MIPILIFLFFVKSKKGKGKWVCFALILCNFAFDLTNTYLSKKPLSSGEIIQSTQSVSGEARVSVNIFDGSLHEGQYVKLGQAGGIISTFSRNNSLAHLIVQLDDPSIRLQQKVIFKSFSNLHVVNTALLVEIVLIFFIFITIFNHHQPIRKFLILSLLICIISWGYYNIIKGRIYSQTVIYNGFTAILIITFALIFFHALLNEAKDRFITNTFEFWVVTGILLYKAGTFFLFLYVNTLHQNEKAQFYIINSLLYIIENICFAVALSRSPRNSVSLIASK